MTGTLALGVLGAERTVLAPHTEPAMGVVGAEKVIPPAPSSSPGEWWVPGGTERDMGWLMMVYHWDNGERGG
jgi:hypothetical protein